MRVEALPVPPRNRIIRIQPSRSHLQVSLQPLYHLKVILRPGLRQLIDIYLLTHPQLIQRLLVQLQVAHELVFKLGMPVEFAHRDYVFVVGVDELAVDRA